MTRIARVRGPALPFLLLGLFLPSPGPAQTPAGEGAEVALPFPGEDLTRKVERVDSIFQGWDRTDAPGCAVGVSLDGRPLLTRAYGMADLEHSVPNTPSTRFEAGSVSKQFVGAAVILLALDGEISLDDDVRSYVPELPDYGHTITLRHLLTHTSGLRDWGSVAGISGWGRGSRTHSHAHVADILSRQRGLNFPPGARYSYSNSGYNLLAMVVDRVREESFAEFSREQIFRPLGMTSTQWRDDYRRVVSGRSSAYSGSEGADTYRINRPIEDVHGNGGLLTSVGDLLRWNEALASGHFGEDFNRELYRQGVLTSGREITYASGIQVTTSLGRTVTSHTGSTAGYRAYLSHFPEDGISVAMLCNVTGVSTGGTGSAVARIFLDVEEEGEEERMADIEPAPGILEELAGVYADEHNHQPTELLVEEGELRTSGGTALLPLSEREFRLGGSDTHYRFEQSDRPGRYEIRVLREGYEEERLLPVPGPRNPSTEELEEYAGTYESPDADTEVTVEVRNGGLVVVQRPDRDFELTPAYEDAFQGFGLMRFLRDDEGRVTGFRYSTGRVYGLRFDRR